MDSVPQKRCTKCGEFYPLTSEYFTRTKSTKDGYHTQCKPCRQVHNRQYWNENADKINQKRREEYPEHRDRNISYHRNWRIEKRDIYLAGKKRWYEENKEYDLAKAKEWREKNPERKKQYDADYAAKNAAKIKPYKADWLNRNRPKINNQRREKYAIAPEGRRISNLLREARKRELPYSFTNEQWVATLDYFGNRCAVCGSDSTIHADHWIPLNSDECPGTVAHNMIPLCKTCNCSKQDTPPDIWFKQKGYEMKFQIIQLYLETLK